MRPARTPHASSSRAGPGAATRAARDRPGRPRARSPPTTTPAFLLAYAAFGLLHELAHVLAAAWLLPPPPPLPPGRSPPSPLAAAARALLGRCAIVTLAAGEEEEARGREARLVLHAGWVGSLLAAAACHWLHARARKEDAEGRAAGRCLRRLFLAPTLPVTAYVTALEAIVTDLLGLIPNHPHLHDPARLVCFCGNFGVLLLNPAWVSRRVRGVADDAVPPCSPVARSCPSTAGGRRWTCWRRW